MSDDVLLGEGSVPRFPRGARLQFNQQRQQWMVQAPERVFIPDEIALAVLVWSFAVDTAWLYRRKQMA